jgi:hypothetical protein
VSGGNEWPIEGPVEGRRLTYLPVAGSVGVRQVENPFVDSPVLLRSRDRACEPARSEEANATPADIDGPADIARIIFRGRFFFGRYITLRERICVCVWKSEENIRTCARTRVGGAFSRHASLHVCVYVW